MTDKDRKVARREWERKHDLSAFDWFFRVWESAIKYERAKYVKLIETGRAACAAFRGSGNGAQALCAVENFEAALKELEGE